LFVLALLALAGVVGEYVVSGGARLWFADCGWTASAVAAVIGVTVATRRSAGREWGGWLLLLGGCVSWLVGQLFWDLFSATSFPGSPNVADICWLAFAVLAAAGMHRLCRGPSRSLGVSVLELAPLIVAISALLVAVLTSDLRSSRLSVAGQLTSLAYPIFYVSAALVTLQAVIAGALELRRNHGLLAVLAGLTLAAIGSILWAPQLLTGTYVVGSDGLDALWSIGMILIGLGAWAVEPTPARADQPISRHRDGVLPALTFVILAAVQTAINAGDGGADLALSVGIAVVGFTLIAHAFFLRRHQAGLFTQLHARERELRDANRLLNEVNDLLSQQSRTDPLTGLANRLRLREDFAELAARAKRYHEGYCVVLIDLDHFKAYNDDHGHQAGDLVLAQIADRLIETMREGDRAYRYGGEELLLVLRGQSLDAALSVAERHRAHVERAALPHALNAPHGVVTLSAGVAAAEPGETPEHVLHRADKALYQAKALGRNRVDVSDPATTPSQLPVVAL
jgi:diguanylate cyclase (GGDEF)-like protein